MPGLVDRDVGRRRNGRLADCRRSIGRAGTASDPKPGHQQSGHRASRNCRPNATALVGPVKLPEKHHLNNP
jgi:hypothetical protein